MRKMLLMWLLRWLQSKVSSHARNEIFIGINLVPFNTILIKGRKDIEHHHKWQKALSIMNWGLSNAAFAWYKDMPATYYYNNVFVHQSEFRRRKMGTQNNKDHAFTEKVVTFFSVVCILCRLRSILGALPLLSIENIQISLGKSFLKSKRNFGS